MLAWLPSTLGLRTAAGLSEAMREAAAPSALAACRELAAKAGKPALAACLAAACTSPAMPGCTEASPPRACTKHTTPLQVLAEHKFWQHISPHKEHGL